MLPQYNEFPRLWSKASITSPAACWLWTAVLINSGYGRFTWKGKEHLAHRVAYEIMRGPIPEGLTIDHLCRVRKCINPFHMEPVTKRENTLRGKAPSAQYAVATHCIQGHPFSTENTYSFTKSSGRPRRVCRACKRDRARTRRKQYAV